MKDETQGDWVALSKLCKWRSILVGWIWGSAAMDQPGSRGRRDLMDRLLVLRAENSAVTQLLLDKGVFTRAEYDAQVAKEAAFYDAQYEQMFQGLRTSAIGVEFYDPALAQLTFQRLGFPP